MTTEINSDGVATSAGKYAKENCSSNSIKPGTAVQSHVGSATNGIANGYSGDKHEHKSSKEKHHDRHKERSRDKDKERSKDKDRHSSSSGKDRDKSHSISGKDKERKDRDHKSSSSKDKEHHKSSSSSKDKDKHTSSSSNRDKDKSSSSSSKDKHSSSSSKDKVKHNSSSSDKKSSSSGDKHKSKDKDSRDKSFKKVEERHKERKSNEVKIKLEPLEEASVKKRESGDIKVKSPIKEEPKIHIKSEEQDSEEEIPLSQRVDTVKREIIDSDDDVPLSARKKPKHESVKKRKAVSSDEEEDDYEDVKPKLKKKKKEVASVSSQGSPKKKKKEEEQEEVWKWWEEKKDKEDGVKWKFLQHLGPMFAPDYEPLPSHVKFSYNGKEMRLSESTEEVATFYAKMLDHDYTSNDVFNKNFFKDWRNTMTSSEKEKITELSSCNFKAMQSYFLEQTEKRKAMTKEEKKELKLKNEEIQKVYGFCMIDGHKEKIGNFRIEPPGLFRGRGQHPRMGMLKKRVMPEQVIINCSKDSKIPKAPSGHKWKEVRHDNTVTWLASWTENVQGQVKYVMLNPSSKLKGEKDWQKYEVARELKKFINKIRVTYQNDWKAKEMMIRQRAVALYFIDKLALRAGNEKDDDQADTVGCCSLRVEHISLKDELGDKKYVVVFDFLGKDSIRYYNEVAVEKRVFKNLQLFMQNKSTGDDLFDRLNTSIMNKHLGELMPGLSAKVFRTYNASITLQEQLNELTEPGMSVQEKILAYNRANRAVAILCNHQRAVPKTHEKSMGNMKEKIATKKEAVKEAEKQYKQAKQERGGSARNKIEIEKKKKAVDRLKEQLSKLKLQATDKEENKDIALGTSKLNYLDPRISIAWCKKHDVPIDKIYNKTQRAKFNWAIDMATADFVF